MRVETTTNDADHTSLINRRVVLPQHIKLNGWLIVAITISCFNGVTGQKIEKNITPNIFYEFSSKNPRLAPKEDTLEPEKRDLGSPKENPLRDAIHRQPWPIDGSANLWMNVKFLSTAHAAAALSFGFDRVCSRWVIPTQLRLYETFFQIDCSCFDSDITMPNSRPATTDVSVIL